MRKVEDTPAHQQFLMLVSNVSEERWLEERQQVLTWARENSDKLKEEQLELLKIIEKPLPETYHPVVIIHCYADVPQETAYDLVFNLSDKTQVETTFAVLKFGVTFSRYCDPSLAHGWHQLAMLDFPNGIPELISELPYDDPSSGEPIGLCSKNNYDSIKNHKS